MPGPRFIDHKGTRIVFLDFAGVKDPAVGLALVAESGRFVQALPRDKSGLSCTDVSDTRYTREVLEAFKVMTKGNAPYIRAAAVVSDSPMHRAAISMISLFSGRKLQTFDSRTQALDWLVLQP